MQQFNDEPGFEENQDVSTKIQGFDNYPLLHPVAAGFFGLIGGFFLYLVGGSILSLSFLLFGYSLDSPPVNGVRIVTIIGQILFLLLPALLFAKWIYGKPSSVITFKLPKSREVFLFVLGAIILIPLLQTYLFLQNSFIEWLASNSSFINSIKSFVDTINELVEKTYRNLILADSLPGKFLVFFTIAIVPAFCEETLFRGFVQNSFTKKMNGTLAAVLTAFFFASYHLNPYGFIPLFILGFYFGFAAYKTGSLVIPVILHFLNNFSAVFLFYLIGDEDIIKSDPTGSGVMLQDVLSFIALLFLFVIIFYLIVKYYSNLKTE